MGMRMSMSMVLARATEGGARMVETARARIEARLCHAILHGHGLQWPALATRHAILPHPLRHALHALHGLS